jgi:hypothetical protein
MKKNKIYFLALLIIGLLFNSCDTNTEEFKAVSSSDSFDSTSGSIIVDSESVVFEVIVSTSEVHTADRSVPIEISNASTGNRLDYSFSGNVDIKAGQLKGSTLVGFDFVNIPSGITKNLILRLVSTSEEITISYTKICASNDIELAITFDDYPEETSWTITDSSNSVVESGGPYPGETIFNGSYTLPDGDYIFTISDAYSDGICCSYGVGSYILVQSACSTIFGQGGEFGAFESVTFSVP